MATLGSRISEALAARGVTHVFGIPGVHNQELYRGLEDSGITHVLARHEEGAGFMADGYARATGRPGVAYVITGPGLLNALTPLGQSYSDSVPVLCIASCLNPGDLGAARGRLHEMRDQEAAAEAVCAWSRTALDADAAYRLIDRAFVEASAGRGRPVAIHVPIKVLGAEAPAAPRPAPLPSPPGPDAAAVAEVAERLRRAERPLFIFGGGTRDADVWRAVVAASGAASLCTYAGRGVIDTAAPLHLGPFCARPGSADVIGRADLVIAVGTELSETDFWRDAPGITGDLVRIDIDPVSLAGHPAAIALLADSGATGRALQKALADGVSETLWRAAEIADLRARWRGEVAAERPGLLPMIEALQAALPEDAVVYSDMTQIAYAAKEVWDLPRPGLWHHPTGFGTLGYALPAAIGGAMGGARAVALAGDYGVQYTIQELATAVELGLPLPILLWDNGKLGEIEDSMRRAQIAPNAVWQRNPDFLKLAEAYGAHAVEPAALADIGPAVAAAFSADRPTLIRLTPALTES